MSPCKTSIGSDDCACGFFKTQTLNHDTQDMLQLNPVGLVLLKTMSHSGSSCASEKVNCFPILSPSCPLYPSISIYIHLCIISTESIIIKNECNISDHGSKERSGPKAFCIRAVSAFSFSPRQLIRRTRMVNGESWG